MTFLLFILTEIYFTFKFSYGILLEFGGNLNTIDYPTEKSQGWYQKEKNLLICFLLSLRACQKTEFHPGKTQPPFIWYLSYHSSIQHFCIQDDHLYHPLFLNLVHSFFDLWFPPRSPQPQGIKNELTESSQLFITFQKVQWKSYINPQFVYLYQLIKMSNPFCFWLQNNCYLVG